MASTSPVPLKNIWPQTRELPPASPSASFSTSSTLAPASAAVMAATMPAKPMPATTTSYSASQDCSAASSASAAPAVAATAAPLTAAAVTKLRRVRFSDIRNPLFPATAPASPLDALRAAVWGEHKPDYVKRVKGEGREI